MKKIINAKLYDTTIAEELAEKWNGLNNRDFRNCTETLFKTKHGSYFLCGEGGALSRWAEHFGNNSSEGCDIIPMDKTEALEWLAKNDFPEIIEKEFPDLIEEA